MKGTKLLELWQCKITVVHALKEHDLVVRIKFLIGFFSLYMMEKLIHNLYFFFWWSLVFLMWRGEFSEQSVLACRKSKTYSRTSWSWWKVWCAISAHRIIGPVFYDSKVNFARYVNNILSPFFAELAEEEGLCSVFQQDSATAHTAHISLEALLEVFGDHVISCGLWPPCSPDLTPCDFYCREV
jgi:hypothetical protein